MAGASLDWADKPSADLVMSSDEEDFASSQDTTFMELETVTQNNLTLALGQLQLEQDELNQASGQEASLNPRPGPHPAPPGPPTAKPLQLLDLPLDVLKEIIKEVTPSPPPHRLRDSL